MPAKDNLEPLEPPDLEQCQALKPNGNSFMTLGGQPGRVRCEAKPTVVVTELTPSVKGDPRCGAMALCDDCLKVALEQLGPNHFSCKRIQACDKTA